MTSQAGTAPDGGAVESYVPAVPRILTVEAMKSPGLRLINRRELLVLVPLSERTILDMERRGAFPQRFTLTPRQVAWDLREIERWMKERRSDGRMLPGVSRCASKKHSLRNNRG